MPYGTRSAGERHHSAWLEMEDAMDPENSLGRLRWYNVGMGLLHAIQGIAVVALSNDFALPVTGTFIGPGRATCSASTCTSRSASSRSRRWPGRSSRTRSCRAERTAPNRPLPRWREPRSWRCSSAGVAANRTTGVTKLEWTPPAPFSGCVVREGRVGRRPALTTQGGVGSAVVVLRVAASAARHDIAAAGLRRRGLTRARGRPAGPRSHGRRR